VAVGDLVARGQIIALSGDSGYSGRPHLHFEVDGACAGCGSIPVTFRNTRPRAVGCAGFARSANAQTLTVKAGVNAANIAQDATFKADDERVAGGGLMVGMQMKRALTRAFQLQIEGLFTQKGNTLRNEGDGMEDTIVISYVEVPALACFGVKRWGRKAVSIHGGPTFAIRTRTVETNNGWDVTTPVKLKRFEMGVAIGGQIELNKIVVGARYTMGVSNIFADDPADFGFSRMKNKVITIFLGYGFR
jgi:hypothetical protein